MTSGSDVDSTQVEAALLAERSQHVQQSRRMQNRDSPVSPRPSTSHADHPNGLIIPHRRHGRLKVKSINVSQMKEVEETHLKCANVAQPP